MRKSEFLRFAKRGIRQGTWPLLQRYLVAPEITKLPAIRIPAASELGVHVFVCEPQAIMLHWALRSLLEVCHTPFSITIHDDGSCSAKTLSLLAEKFPGARIVHRDEAVKLIPPKLSKHTLLKQWWLASACSINVKWIDAYLIGDSPYIILLDPDVLFFDEPLELFQSTGKTVWMRDSSYMLELAPQESVALFGGYPLPQMNTGLGRIERARFDPGLAELLLNHLQTPRDDMTLHAVITAQKPDFEMLPGEYDCATQLGLEGKIAKHYTSPFRLWFYEEGIPRVAKLLGLSNRRWLNERP